MIARIQEIQDFSATVRLGTLNPSLIAEYPPPRTAILEDVSDEASPLLRRLEAHARAQLFGKREIRGKRPDVVADEARPRTVAARRSLAEQWGRPPNSPRYLVVAAYWGRFTNAGLVRFDLVARHGCLARQTCAAVESAWHGEYRDRTRPLFDLFASLLNTPPHGESS